jgi:hypothetical protein
VVTERYLLDDAPDLSCKDSTRQHTVDDPLLFCKQQAGGSSPPPAPKPAGHSHSRAKLTVTSIGSVALAVRWSGR